MRYLPCNFVNTQDRLLLKGIRNGASLVTNDAVERGGIILALLTFCDYRLTLPEWKRHARWDREVIWGVCASCMNHHQALLPLPQETRGKVKRNVWRKTLRIQGSIECPITWRSFFDGLGMRDDWDKALTVLTELDADPTQFISRLRFAPSALLWNGGVECLDSVRYWSDSISRVMSQCLSLKTVLLKFFSGWHENVIKFDINIVVRASKDPDPEH